MKRQLAICFLLVFILVSCTPNDNGDLVETRFIASPTTIVSPKLSTIDSLMWRQPDSALTRLLPCFDTCCHDARFCVSTATEYNRHYANLLLAELLYKNDYAQVNRKELKEAVHYFDSLLLADTRGTDASHASATTPQPHVFFDARAHYINGVGYYETDSVVSACAEYLKALEVMEDNFVEEELVGKIAQFMAMTYTRLTELFSNLYLHEQAVYFARFSLKYYKQYNTNRWHIAWMLNEIGLNYDLMEQLDSADYFYKAAIDTLSDTISQIYRDITVRQAFLAYKRSQQPKNSLAVLQRMVSLSVNERELLTRYLIIGDLYYYEERYDSAWVYLKKVYDNTTSSDSRMLAAERLQDISVYYDDTVSANEYAMTRTQYTIEKDKNGKLISTLTALCQEYKENKIETEHRLRVEKAMKRWGIVLEILMFVIAVTLMFLLKNRKQKRLLKERLENEKYTHKIEQASLAGRLKESNESLREVSKQLKLNMANSIPSKSEHSDDYTAYTNSPICLYIVNLVQKEQFKSKMEYTAYKNNALSKEQILDLRKTAEQNLARFSSNIRTRFPSLTDNDMDYCYLYLLGLSEADISALMQRAYTTVCDRSRKIRRILKANGSLYYALRKMLIE